MSIRPAGWVTVCNHCGSVYGDTHDNDYDAAQNDTGCSDCNPQEG